jgi:hypothetical protein
MRGSHQHGHGAGNAVMLKRFLKTWRLSRSYGSSRCTALQIALRHLRRDFGPTIQDLVDAYRHKNRGL